MSLFDLAAGLVLIVSALVGWMRGGTREIVTVLAFVIAAVVALFALRFTGPIARHAIHTVWIANIAAILIVFVAVYILVRVAGATITRRIHQASGLSGADRALGAGFGLVRALVFLGLVNLTVEAIMPPDRTPAWITGAKLYPVATASGRALRTFAPEGARLAQRVAPTVGNAINDPGDANSADSLPSHDASPDATPERPR